MKEYEALVERMADRYEALSGWRPQPGSDVGLRMQALAWVVADFLEEAAELRGNLFPDTAQGEYLERHGASRGILRKEAAPAVGELTFHREETTGTLRIPAGTVCSVKGPELLRYRTTQEGLLADGEAQCTLPCVCLRAGRLGNQQAGRVTVVDMLLPGVTVNNPAPFLGGCDREEDEAYRRRILAAVAPPSNGANLACYRDVSLAFPGVGSCQVTAQGSQVTVAVWGEEGAAPTAGTIAALQQTLETLREINVTVQVQAATPQTVALRLQVALAAHTQPAVALARCQEEALAYLRELGVGRPLLCAVLCSRLLALPEVENCRVLAPTADQPCPAGSIWVPGTVQAEELEAAV